MALLTTQELLELTQAAYQRCLISQEYRATASGRAQRMADLKSIGAEMARLKAELQSESGGDSMTSLGVYGGVD